MKKTIYDKYKNSKDGFNEFNTFVLNIPRNKFTIMKVDYIKTLASILQNIKQNYSKKMTIEDLYYYIHILLLEKPGMQVIIDNNIVKLFDLELQDEESIRGNYNKDGRKFRHVAEIMKMWGLIDKDLELKYRINYSVCKEYSLINDNEIEILRNKILNMDILENSMFIDLKNISRKIKNNTIFSYKPMSAIIKYINEINRPVSKFEIANLLAIITPECNNANDLYNNAIEIGKEMPEDVSKHQEWFFNYMGWKDKNGKLFKYASSQQPHFKFNVMMIFLEKLGFVQKEGISYILTDYSKELLEDGMPIEITELEKYLEIAEASYSDKALSELILHNTKESVFNTISHNDHLLKCFNKRIIEHPTYDKNGKRIRNKLLAELSKSRVDYNCQIGGIPPFKDSTGKNYVESHHIIEFNREDGPDIIDNLLVINPYYHELIHHAGQNDLRDFYNMLREKKIVTIELFKKMIDDYDCLEIKHLDALLKKELINNDEYNELLEYLYDNSLSMKEINLVEV